MPMPKEAPEAARFVAIVSYGTEEPVERKTFVFEGSLQLKGVFAEIFHEGRTEFSSLPLSIAISPDLTSLPRPKTVLEMLTERDKEWAR